MTDEKMHIYTLLLDKVLNLCSSTKENNRHQSIVL